MSSLHKAPYGFLGALALKALGRTPDEVSDTLIPTFDLTNNYLADTLDILTASGTITAPATSSVISFPVPQGRAYRTLAWHIDANVSDTNRCKAYVAVNQGGGAGGTVYMTGTSSAGQNLAGLRVFTGSPPALLLPAGWGITIGLIFDSAPAAPVPWNAAVLVQGFEN